jgi:hypothetical protein
MCWRALLGCSQSCGHALWHEKFWALLNMMGGAVMIGPVVSQVCCAGPPEEVELALGFTASQLVKLHVHCFDLPWLNVACDNSKGGAVISLHWRGGLWVAHFFQELSLWDCLACIYIECS